MRSAVRTTRVVVLALAAAIVGACDKASDEAGDEAGDEANAGPRDEAAVGAGDKAAVAPGDEECDERHFGDYKTADDFCWDPPSHYCAQGGGGAISHACDPATGICCSYSSTCIPCGFVNCTTCIGQPNPRADCPAVCFGPHSWDPVACKHPDMKRTICYRE